jgi:signal transduction histidine kinase/DNA-binding response OmpR family regulator
MPDDKVDILIVDDLPEKVLVHRAILDELGENLVVARSGPEALAHVLKREFAVILLDVYMPDMDGLETAALIRQRKKSAHTPIIFVTALADEMRVAQGYAQGAVDYILAPVNPEVLRAKVKVFVDLFRMSRQIKRQAEERVALAEERTRRAAAEEANRRLALLARAGAVLGRSLDFERTALDTARLPVPVLADQAALVLAMPAAGPPRTVMAHKADADVIVDGDAELPASLAAIVGRAFAEGVAAFEPVPARGADPSPVAVALPLTSGGRTVAVLALAHSDHGRRFALGDLAAADALASRAASALENARLYQEIQQADRQKNEFLSMLAHELRNPLAPIRNAATILNCAVDDAVNRRWAVGIIERQVGHMVRMVDDLLDISRINRGKIRLRRESIDLGSVVTQAIEASQPDIDARGHDLTLDLPEVPPRVDGDPTRLAQVLTNLLNNAAKYTEPGGRIRLTVETDEGPPPHGDAVVRVRDSGIGIPRDMLTAVFDLFAQVDNSLDRSEGGLGIGLTLVRRIVDMHGGSVQAHSEGPGRGSEFVIRLPLGRRASESLDDGGRNGCGGSQSAETNGRPSRRVLIVDDNADGADSLARLLQLDGHIVRVVHDGSAAITAANEFRPEVVILDIGLPGMDGFEVARLLRGRPDGSNFVLVALTGYGGENERALSRAAGFDHHLVKPVEMVALRRVLEVDGAPVFGSMPCQERAAVTPKGH